MNVFFEKKQALLENATLMCVLGGKIEIHIFQEFANARLSEIRKNQYSVVNGRMGQTSVGQNRGIFFSQLEWVAAKADSLKTVLSRSCAGKPEIKNQ
ncbi:MAG TPA: hypothetical protein DEQ30_15555 [Porphyromonadaceae bacterium]|nr:hypothetical protein [Porphyromonadaceae bacterium]